MENNVGLIASVFLSLLVLIIGVVQLTVALTAKHRVGVK